ncbi:hypothetical protein [Actinacidiphila acididurans]|uniref:Tat pathway signal sequence domain protein n=1 Tax=Actinacidiphila acididurans TaxID=2784346 RepID=A0ABS2TJR3_9ACTN|nr:hypothetical protein [Actinacidiphila acididurans]MBM9503307.1 hypothetical protein [Actinacidiphila acididurans]
MATAGLATAATVLAAPSAGAASSAPHIGHLTASALTAPASRTFTIPAGVAGLSSASHGMRFTVTKTAAQLPQDISCTITANNPFRYYGGPYGGGEEGLAQVQCTAAVYAIVVEADLFRNGVDVASNVRTSYATSLGGVDVEYPVSAGSYQTAAVTDVYWTTSTSYSQIGPVASPAVSL